MGEISCVSQPSALRKKWPKWEVGESTQRLLSQGWGRIDYVGVQKKMLPFPSPARCHCEGSCGKQMPYIPHPPETDSCSEASPDSEHTERYAENEGRESEEEGGGRKTKTGTLPA